MKKRKSLSEELGLEEFYDKSTAFDIGTETVKQAVKSKLFSDDRERILIMKRKKTNIALIAAAICAIAVTTSFASPTVRDKVGEIISFFQNENAAEISSIDRLAEFNESIGKSITKNGYTLTLDNVAADDNFVHVFYTIHSEDKPLLGEDGEPAVNGWTECVINGKSASLNTNHNSNDYYFADSYTAKYAEKYNVAAADIPNKFMLELYADIGEITTGIDDKIYNGEPITDEDKEKMWYISAEIDKSAVKVESVTRQIGINLPDSIATVEKAVFSPFGNQLVITTKANNGGADSVVPNVDNFALYDENNTCLDVLNTDLCANSDGSSSNSFEFLKADVNTRELKFVPVKYSKKSSDSKIIFNPVGTYPAEYKTSDYGKVVVTGIKIKDGEIDIDYYKDGFVMYDPAFVLANDAGENAEPGGKHGCTRYINVNYETNSYTARYVYESFDSSGKPLPLTENVKADSLKKNFTKLGVIENHDFTLDFDNAVTVKLTAE